MPRRTLALVAAAGVAAGLLLFVALEIAAPSTGIPWAAAVGAAGLGVLLAVAVLHPEAGLVMSLGYAASPLSFYVLFRGTEDGAPYPTDSSLAIDAATVLGLAGAAAVGMMLRSWGRGTPLLPAFPVRRPLLAVAAVLAVTAIVGLALGNPTRLVLADIVPFAEVGVLALLTAGLIDTRAKALLLLRAIGAVLVVTAIVRLVLYAQGPNAFGVESVSLGGSARPRLYQTYQYGWALPFAIAAVIAARGWLDRASALVVALLSAVMVLLSFERALWVFAAVGTLAVLVFGVRHRPRMMAPLVAAAAVAFVLGAGLLGGGSGFTDPLSLVRDRLAGTSQQLGEREGIGHKRQDEAEAIWHRIRDDEAGWPLGHGLGAQYVGPTAVTEGAYEESFREKHYSFNWYLATAFRTGLLGLLAALWLLAAIAFTGWRAFRGQGSLLARGVGLALAAGMLGLALVAPINPYLLTHPLASFQGATLALVLLASRRELDSGAAVREEDETDRIRRVYGEYDSDPHVQARRDPDNQANLLIDRERVEAVDAALDGVESIDLAAADVLDVGCGAGDELARLVARGADPGRCHGVDLLPDRVARAHERLPAADIREADARELPFADATMDVVILKVVLSSVLDRAVTAQIASEVDRVLRPGGAIVWYDNRYGNPANGHVRGITRDELARLFPGYNQRLRTITVIPPIVRGLGGRVHWPYRMLNRISPLRVRYAGVLVKIDAAGDG